MNFHFCNISATIFEVAATPHLELFPARKHDCNHLQEKLWPGNLYIQIILMTQLLVIYVVASSRCSAKPC